ncbi:MAG TPA: hypothetical protein VMU09_09690 [Acidimicrobiales bacterium]|nr:hypothetical protein [Acidimicrobiales bacterium]
MRITATVLEALAAAAAREACEAVSALRAAEAFDRRRCRCAQLVSSVLDRAGELLGRFGVTTRTTTALRDGIARLPRAFDVAFHIDGEDRDASLVLTVVEGYDTVKAVRCITSRRLGTDPVKRSGTLGADELTDDAMGELVAMLVDEFFGPNEPVPTGS